MKQSNTSANAEVGIKVKLEIFGPLGWDNLDFTLAWTRTHLNHTSVHAFTNSQ